MSDGRVEYEIRGSSAKLGSDLDAASDQIAKKTAKWTVIGQTAMKAVGSAAKAIGSGVKSLIENAIEYNAEMETYTASFVTMLGSQEAAEAKMAELKKYAAETPFEFPDIAKATQTMLSFGLSSEDTSKALKQLGDISQGDANKLNSLSLAFAQMSSTGKLMGQDLNQMINAGFNPLQAIAEETGATIGDLKEAMGGGKGSAEFQKMVKDAQTEVKKLGDNASDGAKMLAQIGTEGQIGIDLITWSMEKATSEGGLFFGAMERQSKTFNGQMATLKDNFDSLNGEVFKGLTDSLAGDVLPMVNGYLDQLSTAFKKGGTKGLIKSLGGVLGDAIGKVSLALPDAMKAVNSVVKSLIGGLRDSSPEIGTGLGDMLVAAVDGLADALPDLIGATVSIALTLVSSLAEKLPEMLPKLVTALVDTLLQLFGEAGTFIDTGFAIIKALQEALILSVGTLIEAVPTLLEGMFNAFVDYASSYATNAVNGIIGLLNMLFGLNIPEIGKIKLPTWAELKGNFIAWWDGIDGIRSFITKILNWTLGALGLPEWDVLSGQIEAWWGRILVSLTRVVSWVLGALGLPEWVDLKDQIGAWWTRIRAWLVSIADWALGKMNLPSVSEIAGEIRAWWQRVLNAVGDLFFSVEVDADGNKMRSPASGGPVDGYASGGIFSGGATMLDKNGDPNLVGEAGAEAILPLDVLWSHMGGLMDSRLTYALSGLDLGYRGMPSIGIDNDALARAIWQNAPDRAFGGNVYMGAEKVGQMVSGIVSDEQAQSLIGLERSGWYGGI